MLEEPTTPAREGGVIKPVSQRNWIIYARFQKCQAVPGEPGTQRTGKTGNQESENRLQPCFRLLYRKFSKANAAQAPKNYIPSKTLSTGERYFTAPN